MKQCLLIFLNYFVLFTLCLVDYYDLVQLPRDIEGFFSSFFLYDILAAFDSTITYSYNPNGAILFVFHLSIIPLLLGFIKNNKILFFLMVVYLFIELIYIAFVSFIMGV